jgi:hypothetical protein
MFNVFHFYFSLYPLSFSLSARRLLQHPAHVLTPLINQLLDPLRHFRTQRKLALQLRAHRVQPFREDDRRLLQILVFDVCSRLHLLRDPVLPPFPQRIFPDLGLKPRKASFRINIINGIMAGSACFFFWYCSMIASAISRGYNPDSCCPSFTVFTGSNPSALNHFPIDRRSAPVASLNSLIVIPFDACCGGLRPPSAFTSSNAGCSAFPALDGGGATPFFFLIFFIKTKSSDSTAPIRPAAPAAIPNTG